MRTLPETILQRARSLPEGGVLSPKEFLHQGSRADFRTIVRRVCGSGSNHKQESCLTAMINLYMYTAV
jgi:hypothetical protein